MTRYIDIDRGRSMKRRHGCRNNKAVIAQMRQDGLLQIDIGTTIRRELENTS